MIQDILLTFLISISPFGEAKVGIPIAIAIDNLATTTILLIGVLGIARIPFEKWFKWVAPFIIILMILGFLLLLPTVLMNLNGF